MNFRQTLNIRIICESPSMLVRIKVDFLIIHRVHLCALVRNFQLNQTLIVWQFGTLFCESLLLILTFALLLLFVFSVYLNNLLSPAITVFFVIKTLLSSIFNQYELICWIVNKKKFLILQAKIKLVKMNMNWFIALFVLIAVSSAQAKLKCKWFLIKFCK